MASRYTLPKPPHPTPVTGSLLSRKGAPIHNPYDKLSKPQFDAFIGDITGQLRRALGYEVPPPPARTDARSGAYSHEDELLARGSGAHAAEDESVMEDSFAEVKIRLAKGKGRDPREGPGLGGKDAPIELLSDSEDEQDEQQAAEYEEQEEYEEDIEEVEKRYLSEGSPGAEEYWEEGSLEDAEGERELRSSPPEVYELVDSDEGPDAAPGRAPEVVDEFANEPAPEYDDDEDAPLSDDGHDPNAGSTEFFTSANYKRQHNLDEDGYDADGIMWDDAREPAERTDDDDEYDEDGIKWADTHEPPVEQELYDVRGQRDVINHLAVDRDGYDADGVKWYAQEEVDPDTGVAYDSRPIGLDDEPSHPTMPLSDQRASPKIFQLIDDHVQEEPLAPADLPEVEKYHFPLDAGSPEPAYDDVYSEDEVTEHAATPVAYPTNQPVYEILDDDEPEDELEHSENRPTGMSLVPEQPIALVDPWSGPREYAEDFYSGGDFPEGVLAERDVSPSRLTPEREAFVAQAGVNDGELGFYNNHDRDAWFKEERDAYDDQPHDPEDNLDEQRRPFPPAKAATEVLGDVIPHPSNQEGNDDEIVKVAPAAGQKEKQPHYEDVQGVDVDAEDDNSFIPRSLARSPPPHMLLSPAERAASASEPQPVLADLEKERSASPNLRVHEKSPPAIAANGHVDWTHPPAFPVDDVHSEDQAPAADPVDEQKDQQDLEPSSQLDDAAPTYLAPEAGEQIMYAHMPESTSDALAQNGATDAIMDAFLDEIAPAADGNTQLDFGSLPATPREDAPITAASQSTVDYNFLSGTTTGDLAQTASQDDVQDFLNTLAAQPIEDPLATAFPATTEAERLDADAEVALMTQWLAGEGDIGQPAAVTVEVTTEEVHYIVSEPVDEAAVPYEDEDDVVSVGEEPGPVATYYVVEEVLEVYEEEEIILEPSMPSVQEAADQANVLSQSTDIPEDTDVRSPHQLSEATAEPALDIVMKVDQVEEGFPLGQSGEGSTAVDTEVLSSDTAVVQTELSTSPVAKLLPDLEEHVKAVVSGRDGLTLPLPPFLSADLSEPNTGPLTPYFAETPRAAYDNEGSSASGVGYFTPSESGAVRPALSRTVSITRVIPASPSMVEALNRQRLSSGLSADDSLAEKNGDMQSEKRDEDALVLDGPVLDHEDPPRSTRTPPDEPEESLPEEDPLTVPDLLDVEEQSSIEAEVVDHSEIVDVDEEEGELTYPDLPEAEGERADDISDHDSIASTAHDASPPIAQTDVELETQSQLEVIEEADPLKDDYLSMAQSPLLEPIYVREESEEIPGLSLGGTATPRAREVVKTSIDASPIRSHASLSRGDSEPEAFPEASEDVEPAAHMATPKEVPFPERQAAAVEHLDDQGAIPGLLYDGSVSSLESNDHTFVREGETAEHTAVAGDHGHQPAPTWAAAQMYWPTHQRPSTHIGIEAYPYYLSTPRPANVGTSELTPSDESTVDEEASNESFSSSVSKSSGIQEKNATKGAPQVPQQDPTADRPEFRSEDDDLRYIDPQVEASQPVPAAKAVTVHTAEDVDADAEGEVDADYFRADASSEATPTITPEPEEASFEPVEANSVQASDEEQVGSLSVIGDVEGEAVRAGMTDSSPRAEILEVPPSVADTQAEGDQIPDAELAGPDITTPTPPASIPEAAPQVEEVSRPSEAPVQLEDEGRVTEPMDSILVNVVPNTPAQPSLRLDLGASSSPLSDIGSPSPVVSNDGSQADAETDSSGPELERPTQPALSANTPASSSATTPVYSLESHGRAHFASSTGKRKSNASPIYRVSDDQDEEHIDNTLGGANDDEDSDSSLSTIASPVAARPPTPRRPQTPRSFSLPQVPVVQRGNIYHQHGQRKNLVTQLPGRPMMPQARRSAKEAPGFSSQSQPPTAPLSQSQSQSQIQLKLQPLSQPTASLPNLSRLPVTRSHCKFHKISVEREDDGPRVFFIVPSCSLVNREFMDNEDIQDHGDATVDDTLRMEADVENLDLSWELISNLRLLVGMDMLRELEIFYLPVDGVEVRRKRRVAPAEPHGSERMKKRESIARVGRGALQSDIASGKKRKRAETSRAISTASFSDNEGSVKGKGRAAKVPKRMSLIIRVPRPQAQASLTESVSTRSTPTASASASVSASVSATPSTSARPPPSARPTRARRSKPDARPYKESSLDEESDSGSSISTVDQKPRRRTKSSALLKRKRAEDDGTYRVKRKKADFP